MRVVGGGKLGGGNRRVLMSEDRQTWSGEDGAAYSSQTWHENVASHVRTVSFTKHPRTSKIMLACSVLATQQSLARAHVIESAEALHPVIIVCVRDVSLFNHHRTPRWKEHSPQTTHTSMCTFYNASLHRSQCLLMAGRFTHPSSSQSDFGSPPA
jgi:hypothetical protein